MSHPTELFYWFVTWRKSQNCIRCLKLLAEKPYNKILKCSICHLLRQLNFLEHFRNFWVHYSFWTKDLSKNPTYLVRKKPASICQEGQSKTSSSPSCTYWVLDAPYWRDSIVAFQQFPCHSEPMTQPTYIFCHSSGHKVDFIEPVTCCCNQSTYEVSFRKHFLLKWFSA